MRPQKLVFQIMTATSLPSTLVKCLYLFFDLTPLDKTPNADKSDVAFTKSERRILLQKMFIQVKILTRNFF